MPAYYQRFASALEVMVLQSARRAPVPWKHALLVFLRRVEGADLRWWLYGSAVLAVRGIPVEPADIDLNVGDSSLAGRILDDRLITPVLEMDGWVARHMGRAFDEAIIEWLSEPHRELDDVLAPHEQGPLVESRLETVEWQGHLVHVPPLDVQLQVCEARGLRERAELIRMHGRR